MIFEKERYIDFASTPDESPALISIWVDDFFAAKSAITELIAGYPFKSIKAAIHQAGDKNIRFQLLYKDVEVLSETLLPCSQNALADFITNVQTSASIVFSPSFRESNGILELVKCDKEGLASVLVLGGYAYIL